MALEPPVSPSSPAPQRAETALLAKEQGIGVLGWRWAALAKPSRNKACLLGTALLSYQESLGHFPHPLPE